MFHFALFQLLIASQCLVLPLFLARKGRWRQPANRILIALLLMFGSSSAVGGVQRLTGTLAVNATTLFGVLFGPAVWAFVRSLAFPERGWRRRDLLHLAPFAFALLAFASGHLPDGLRLRLTAASLWTYAGATLALWWRYRRTLRSTRSGPAGERTIWVDFAAFGFLALNLLDTGTVITAHWVRWTDPVAVRTLFFVALLAYIAGFVYLALECPGSLVGVSALEQSAAEAPPAPQPLEPADRAELERIEAAVTARRLYLEPDLTLPELAERLGVPARRLSSLVNRGHGRNFSDWINGYRIEEAARRLADPAAAGENVLDVLYASGFNSKSSFNAAFKRLKGITPSEFRRTSHA